MTEKTTVGDVCFIRKHEKVLLLRRIREPLKGKWTGVGGKTEFNEEPMESCIREVREETGLHVKPVLAAIITTINKLENSKWFLFVYLADNPRGRLKESSEGQLKWVEEEKLYDQGLIGFIRASLPHIMKKKTKGVITGKIVHDEKGEVLNCILRDDENILVQISKKPR